ncbi:MAG: DegT/DnrJ/EryC1/StrS family aminotransferase [Planctomycetota bacterium]
MGSPLALLGGTPVRREPWPAWPQHGPAVRDAIDRVARSNCYHPQFGGETEAFEQAFAAFHDGGHAVAVANGTLALQAAMAAAGVGCGDEVIVPAYTYVASASAAVDQNAVPVFVDSEPASQGLDADDVRRKITPRTKAIVAVHTNGYPCDMDAVMAVAADHDLVVIEDCSHAHGARHNGRRVGTIGHLGAFSLQNKKNLSAGIGGIVFTRDRAMADRMREARNFTWNAIGHNWQISEFHAAIAAAQLPTLDVMNDARRANVATLLEALGTVEGLTPLPGLPGTEPVYYNLILQYDEAVWGVSRGTFVKAMNAEGIPIRMFYVPLQRWPIFARADMYGRGCPFRCPHNETTPDYGKVTTPVAEAICDRINLEIKVHPTCGEREMRQVAQALHKLVAHKGELVRMERSISEERIPC